MFKTKSVLFFVFLLSIMACSEKVPTSEQLTMLVTTNVRGQLDPCGWKANPLGGLPRRLTYINQLREGGVDPVLLDAGDALFELNIFSKWKRSLFKAQS